MTDLELVQNDWGNIIKMRDPSEEVCKAALDGNWKAIKYIWNQTPEVSWYAMTKSRRAINYIRNDTVYKELRIGQERADRYMKYTFMMLGISLMWMLLSALAYIAQTEPIGGVYAQLFNYWPLLHLFACAAQATTVSLVTIALYYRVSRNAMIVSVFRKIMAVLRVPGFCFFAVYFVVACISCAWTVEYNGSEEAPAMYIKAFGVFATYRQAFTHAVLSSAFPFAVGSLVVELVERKRSKKRKCAESTKQEENE